MTEVLLISKSQTTDHGVPYLGEIWSQAAVDRLLHEHDWEPVSDDRRYSQNAEPKTIVPCDVARDSHRYPASHTIVSLRDPMHRADPDLIETFSELGTEALQYSNHAVSIVEVPDDMEYSIRTRGSGEYIAEQHRTITPSSSDTTIYRTSNRG